MTLNLTDVIIDKNYTCKIWNMKGFYKMGRVVVVTFDENEEAIKCVVEGNVVFDR